MTTITLEGKEYQLDIEQAKQLGLLKEKDNRVRSWKEFINKHINSNSFYCSDGTVRQTTSPYDLPEQLTPHEAKALAAFSKLLKLRRDWIGEWEPDFKKDDKKWAIYRKLDYVKYNWGVEIGHALSFPTEQMAKDFLETFRDLIEEAKILI